MMAYSAPIHQRAKGNSQKGESNASSRPTEHSTSKESAITRESPPIQTDLLRTLRYFGELLYCLLG